MPTNQEGVQAAIRASTGTTLDYNGDWSALFDLDAVAAGDWNGRLLGWINQRLVADYADVPAAMQAFAEANSVANWDSLGTFTAGTLFLVLLEDGTGFIELEDALGFVALQ